jgi:hypothetical protein
MKALAFAILALGLAAPTTAAIAADDAPAAKPKKEKRICKRVERPASRMPTRVCRTQAEWDGTSLDADQDALEHLNTEAKTGCGGGMGGCSGGTSRGPGR